MQYEVSLVYHATNRRTMVVDALFPLQAIARFCKQYIPELYKVSEFSVDYLSDFNIDQFGATESSLVRIDIPALSPDYWRVEGFEVTPL